MRKNVAILGTLLTVVILISGSAVAAWHHGVSIHGFVDCTNRNEILGAEDGSDATIGVNAPPEDKLGEIVLNLSYGHEMGANQDFTVFATLTDAIETYGVFISPEPNFTTSHFCGYGTDDDDEVFQTPSFPLEDWLYIKIVGTYGYKSGSDTIYGPEIDAVGWED